MNCGGMFSRAFWSSPAVTSLPSTLATTVSGATEATAGSCARSGEHKIEHNNVKKMQVFIGIFFQI
jgi:hypothetical protein